MALFDDLNGPKIEEMKHAAFCICDGRRDGKTTYEDLGKALKKLEPDIPKEKISRLYGYGMFASR